MISVIEPRHKSAIALPDLDFVLSRKWSKLKEQLESLWFSNVSGLPFSPWLLQVSEKP